MDKPERRRRGPIGWLAGRSWWVRSIAVVMPVLYILSIPVLEWFQVQGWLPEGSTRMRFAEGYAAPVNWVFDSSPQSIRDFIHWYAFLLR